MFSKKKVVTNSDNTTLTVIVYIDDPVQYCLTTQKSTFFSGEIFENVMNISPTIKYEMN